MLIVPQYDKILALASEIVYTAKFLYRQQPLGELFISHADFTPVSNSIFRCFSPLEKVVLFAEVKLKHSSSVYIYIWRI